MKRTVLVAALVASAFATCSTPASAGYRSRHAYRTAGYRHGFHARRARGPAVAYAPAPQAQPFGFLGALFGAATAPVAQAVPAAAQAARVGVAAADGAARAGLYGAGRAARIGLRTATHVADAVLAPVAGAWVGKASFYSGGRTASGGSVGAATCAHRTLPFGTRVRVTNLANHHVAILVVNDRGPFVRGRIVDVSRTAASGLGMIGSGVAPVRVEVVASR